MNAATPYTAPSAALSLVPVLVAALRAVANEVTPGVKPCSADSYLPEHVCHEVSSVLDRVGAIAVPAESALSTHCLVNPAAILSRTHFASDLLKQIEGRLLFVGSDATRRDVIRVLVAIEDIAALLQEGGAA